jgi:hypothetical protein
MSKDSITAEVKLLVICHLSFAICHCRNNNEMKNDR